MKIKFFQSLVLLGVVLSLAASAQARASFKGKAQMINTAQVIAIVEVTAVEAASVKGQHWTYRQKADAKIETVLKGELPSSAIFYGDETFICAQCTFAVGRYLVFLDRDGELLTGNNWQFSTRKISGDEVEWFGGENIFEKKLAPLTNVTQEIQQIISQNQ